MKLSSFHLNLVQSVIKLMNLIISKDYYYHWQSIGGSCFIALEKFIVSYEFHYFIVFILLLHAWGN